MGRKKTILTEDAFNANGNVIVDTDILNKDTSEEITDDENDSDEVDTLNEVSAIYDVASIYDITNETTIESEVTNYEEEQENITDELVDEIKDTSKNKKVIHNGYIDDEYYM